MDNLGGKPTIFRNTQIQKKALDPPLRTVTSLWRLLVITLPFARDSCLGSFGVGPFSGKDLQGFPYPLDFFPLGLENVDKTSQKADFLMEGMVIFG